MLAVFREWNIAPTWIAADKAWDNLLYWPTALVARDYVPYEPVVL